MNTNEQIIADCLALNVCSLAIIILLIICFTLAMACLIIWQDHNRLVKENESIYGLMEGKDMLIKQNWKEARDEN